MMEGDFFLYSRTTAAEGSKETSRNGDRREENTLWFKTQPIDKWKEGSWNRKLSLGGAMLQQLAKSEAILWFCDSLGRRNSEVPGRLVKKHTSSAAKLSEIESPAVRKPLSPLFAVNSNANIVNFMEDQKKVQNGRRLYPGCTSPTGSDTPAKPTLIGDEENRTPKAMPIPMPTTSSTVSASMLVAITPATPANLGAYNVEKILEQVQQTECSFEEARAGFFFCPKDPEKPVCDLRHVGTNSSVNLITY